MNDLTFPRVQIDQRIEQLIGPGNHLCARKWTRLLRSDLGQIVTGNELQYQKGAAVFREVITDARQRLGITLGQHPRLLLELSTQAIVNREWLLNLQGRLKL